MKSILTSTCDADLMEQLLVILTYRKAELIEIGDTTRNEESRRLFEGIPSQKLNSNTDIGEDEVVGIKMRTKWLKAISEFDKFDLTIRFVSPTLLSDAADILQRGAELQMIDCSIIEKYQHCSKTVPT